MLKNIEPVKIPVKLKLVVDNGPVDFKNFNPNNVTW
jgi:hypothetical protein